MKDIVRAFPRNPGAFDGMDLRDYFAAKAMAANSDEGWTSLEALADWSYKIADAMMEARKK